MTSMLARWLYFVQRRRNCLEVLSASDEMHHRLRLVSLIHIPRTLSGDSRWIVDCSKVRLRAVGGVEHVQRGNIALHVLVLIVAGVVKGEVGLRLKGSVAIARLVMSGMHCSGDEYPGGRRE